MSRNVGAGIVAASVAAVLAVAGFAQVPQRGGQPPAGGRGGGPALMLAPPKPLIANAKPARSCDSLASIALPNTTIESAAIDANNPDICRVVAITTHPPAGDKVRIWVAIPATGWNGRFMGTGGGGFAGGQAAGVNGPVALGFAAGATDTGHTGGSAAFALGADGKLDWQAIRNFAHVGIHEMTVTGKALTEAMYGVAPRYSYFNGCSTGGRQGLMEAQRYPQDYNGIASAAPAINWTNLLVHSLWGSMLMQNASNPIEMCKLALATETAVAACDATDGVTDGVIEEPGRCAYDPKALVGAATRGCGPFTQADADIIRKLWDGPRRLDGGPLWYGMPRGADLNALSTSRGTPLAPQVFGFANDWLRYFIHQDAQFDWRTVTPDAYQALWDRSYEQYANVIGTDNPDLSAFRDRGGKTIIWHGWADQLITADGSIDYYKRVQQRMGGAKATSNFARLYMAPGVAHCTGGPGPQPTGVLDALLAWVETGQAPETLTAVRRDQSGAVQRSRPLCQYPLVARYSGKGSTDDASNFMCSAASGQK
jgi:feruloyl esterase